MAIQRYPSNHAERDGAIETPSGCPCVSIDIPDASDPLGDKFSERLREQDPPMRCVVRRSPTGGARLDLFVENGNVYMLSARKSGRDWSAATAHPKPHPIPPHPTPSHWPIFPKCVR